MRSGWLGTGLLLLALTPAHSVEISPDRIVIASRSQPEQLRITDQGRPVSRSAIGSVQFMVDGHSYGHMIDVERIDGGLIVRPTEDLEIGTYDLQITVGKVREHVEVVATLTNDPDSIEQRAAAEGITPEQLRQRLGLYRTGRHSLRIDVADAYTIGRRIRFDMPAPDHVRYEWHVNGEAVDSGYGPHVFEYTFRRPGEYRFEYFESGPDGSRARAAATTRAREPAAQVVEAAPDQPVRLLGPAGFSEYMWLINGEIVSGERDLERAFEAPGSYRVECVATGAAAEHIAFQKAVYEVVVR